jgi:hypothetical protein
MCRSRSLLAERPGSIALVNSLTAWDWILICVAPIAFFAYESWSQPDLALWVRLIPSLGWVTLMTAVLIDGPVWLVVVGIVTLPVGILMFRWARDGGGPEWFYRKVRQ